MKNCELSMLSRWIFRGCVFVVVGFLLSCNLTPPTNSDILKVEHKTLLFSIDAISGSDTLQFNDNGNLVYVHTGIGVRFDGKYIVKKNRINIKIFDFVNQFDKNATKEIVLEFDLAIEKTKHIKVESLKKKDHLFSKASLSSKVEFILD